jgi:uncharacterized membrane protein YccC
MHLGGSFASLKSRLANYWNWKAGMLSAASRGALFVALTVSHGKRYAVAAFLIEAIYRTITSGFYGAITQALRDIRPAWAGVAIFAVVLPVVVQTLDTFLHVLGGTPNLWVGTLISGCWTALASLFDWYAMRKGVLLTGHGSQSLLADAKAIPEVLRAGWRDLFKRTKGGDDTALLADDRFAD